MDDCLFCKIINGDIPCNKVYEDNDILAFYDVNPATPIHILVIPKKHIVSVIDVKPEEGFIISKIFSVINEIAKNMKFDNDGFRVITNCGNDSGQEVKHLHFHVLAGRNLGSKIIE
ncbi:MAG TPA: histidine triad nucleotide-binding protein [Clostridia bacterium]|nr:histidine triad nucleotide-binding protein [Clostridia bacterium]